LNIIKVGVPVWKIYAVIIQINSFNELKEKLSPKTEKNEIETYSNKCSNCDR
jgi:hypothetical protein